MPSEHVELLGITTNSHPTRLRQGVAKAVVAAAAGVPAGVAAGEGLPDWAGEAAAVVGGLLRSWCGARLLPCRKRAGATEDEQRTCPGCPGGSFSGRIGQVDTSSCQACPLGKYGDPDANMTVESACTNCASGRYSETFGIVGAEQCEMCPAPWAAADCAASSLSSSSSSAAARLFSHQRR